MADSKGNYVASIQDVVNARDRIRPYGVNETPIHTSETMNALSGHDLWDTRGQSSGLFY
jgi:hypothetical protein